MGVTDRAWAEFLAQRPHLGEINFWRPSSNQVFKRIGLGDLFLFKTRYPHNRIVGGAVFSRFTQAPLSAAWEAFGEGNGRGSLEELREALNRYRVKEGNPAIRAGEDPLIGCVMLRDPVFFDGETFAPPSDFASNLVQGKGYDDVTDSAHAAYFTPIADRVLRGGGDAPVGEGSDDSETWAHHGPVRGPFRPVRQRLGQEAFKLALMDAYQGRCAVTGRDVRPTLEAAHIHPVANGGLHRLDNGLLLRADVHKLYDSGYLTITPKLTVQVSSSLHQHSPNAKEYTSLAGTTIAVPRRRVDRPHRDALAWHAEKVFKSG
ncbi:HNH endonuclease [Nocardiopsis exhalans]|uniref:HNH endonuclease n=1 Tax=Nocardiopsis exhalans TaxID=163604 RepID=A0ABY5DDV5_9ACTN|nr:HNH endonuclease [Nocardiopsis exhalans]USY22516.1 HNH endonuclease [Nocardiopsis exhalans]